MLKMIKCLKMQILFRGKNLCLHFKRFDLYRCKFDLWVFFNLIKYTKYFGCEMSYGFLSMWYWYAMVLAHGIITKPIYKLRISMVKRGCVSKIKNVYIIHIIIIFIMPTRQLNWRSPCYEVLCKQWDSRFK